MKQTHEQCVERGKRAYKTRSEYIAKLKEDFERDQHRCFDLEALEHEAKQPDKRKD
jgi:hypothetical protein